MFRLIVLRRDERLGWTGDAQVFARTAAFNMNVNNVFARWLQDLESEQIEGKVPHVIPHVVQPENVNSAGWADASTIIPWDMYVSYGDRELLARQYNSMKAFHESVKELPSIICGIQESIMATGSFTVLRTINSVWRL
jgi:alpha-L-rhamnosidase